MKILLKHGVDANIANSKKELPLHKACTSDRNIEVRRRGWSHSHVEHGSSWLNG